MHFKLKQNFKQPIGKLLHNADVKACLSDLPNKYVFVPADKAPNNIRSICKRYYIETLINYLSHSPSYGQETLRVVPNTPARQDRVKKLGLGNCSTTTGNSTYTSCQMSSEDIVNTL